jgi:M6 family metalloprotease-like protein
MKLWVFLSGATLLTTPAFAQPNLSPHQPPGWSAPIVVSNATGTSTDSSGLPAGETLYIDWAVTNSGTATDARFYTDLYVDDVLRASWYTDPPLNGSTYSYVADQWIGSLSAGTHTIRISTDATGVINETNESDNQYTRTITVSASLPNLVPYQPTNWSAPIVVSKIAGTSLDSADLLSTDILHLDWAVANLGASATAAQFYSELYVDDVLRATWYTDPPLNASTYTFIQDYSIGPLSAGSHTLRISTDSAGTVSETNESDNQYTKIITVAAALPNLTPYQPPGWPAPIVISKVTGTNSDASTLFSTDTLYVDWAILNNGGAAVSRIYTELYVDDLLRASWFTDPPFDANSYTFVSDHSLEKLSPGTHTIRISTDSSGAVSESNEADNQYTKTITVNTAINLTPFQPPGWSTPIAISTVPGTTANMPTPYANDNLYLDWAVLNNGSLPTAARFYTELYVDDVLRTSWFSDPPLAEGSYIFITDYLLGSLSEGTHTIRISTDSTGTIPESDETDNQYTRTLTVLPTPAVPNLVPFQPSGWSDEIVVSKSIGTSTDDATLAATDTLYLDWAAINNGGTATQARFYTQIFVDGTLRATWYTDPPLSSSSHTFAQDYSLGTLTCGTHSISITVDTTLAIAESNEADNQYARSVTVGSNCASQQPNVTRYQPTGWPAPIVVSRTQGNQTDDTFLQAADTLYVDWSIANLGAAATTANFDTSLFVDGVLKAVWYIPAPFASNFYTYVLDHNIGSLGPGSHTLQIVADSSNVLAESDENDNQYTRTIVVHIGGGPNLRPNQPAGWSAPIVVSKVQGTNTDNTGLQTSDSLYVDWSVINNGSQATETGFVTELYVDGVLRNSWTYPSSLASNSGTQVSDYSIGSLANGSHTLVLKTDALGQVSETDETDNQYSKLNIVVGAAGVMAKALVLLVDYPDKPAQVSRNYFQEMMFGINYPPSAPQGSFRDFYREMSYGTFDVTGTINDGTIAWIRLPRNSNYYAAGCFGIGLGTNCESYPQNAQGMVEDAVVAARNLGIDFGSFDANNDGMVDSLFVVHSGPGGETSGNANDIWSHAWVARTPIYTGSTNLTGQPVFVSGYTMEPEYISAPNDLTMGVFAHEFGHSRFGLPDLYDVDYSSSGVGRWSLMAGGVWNGTPGGATPAHMDAWSKYHAGFLVPTKVTSTLTNEAIDQAATSPDVYQVLDGAASPPTGEYFLIENRQRAGFDIGLPHSGLLIWHIDESQDRNSNENYPGCTICSGHFKVSLIQADNLYDLEKRTNSGDSGDPFPGTCVSGPCSTAFTGTTNPDSKLWNGQNSGVSVTNISPSATRMTATISVTGTAPKRRVGQLISD